MNSFDYTYKIMTPWEPKMANGLTTKMDAEGQLTWESKSAWEMDSFI